MRGFGTTRWVLSGLLLAGIGLGGCSDDVETGGQGEEATSGGDDGWNENDGWMKQVAPQERTAREPSKGPGGAHPKQDFSPTVPEGRPVAEGGAPAPAPSSGPSPWGAPDAACARPLPKRSPMSGAAAQANKEGMAASRRGDNVAAKAAFERALATDAKAYEAAYNLGVVLDRLGQTNAALQAYGRALKIQPDYERAVWGAVNIYQRQGTAAQAVSFAEPIARRYECNLYLQAILADALVKADRLDQAEQVAREALRRDERFVPAMLSLAKASFKRGRTELGNSILEQAEAIDANNPELHFLQGQAHDAEGELAKALASYRRAIEIRPDYAEAQMALGIQYMAAGNYAEAQRSFETVARLMPTLPAAHLNLGDAYRANKHWKEAKRELDTALRMQDDLPEAHFNLALMYMSAGEEFPGLDRLQALQRAVLELNAYRAKAGPAIKRDDPAAAYLADIQRQIEREQRRIEREAERKKKEAERAARQKAMEAQ